MKTDVSAQRTTEWLEDGDALLSYFERQFTQPFRSTICLCDWLERMGYLTASMSSRVADVGAGMGQTLAYMARRFPNVRFTGIELNPRHVERGHHMLQRLGLANMTLVEGDLFNLDSSHRHRYDGIICLQTLSWLPEFQTPLQRMMELGPRWIALTSLFFDGPVNTRIEIQDYSRPGTAKPYREEFTNVYSLPLIRQYMAEQGFDEFHYEPFHIDIDLPKPSSSGMGTYTVKLDTGQRLQMSGPLVMNWYFVLARSRVERVIS